MVTAVASEPEEDPKAAEIEPDAGAPLPTSTALTSESDPLVRLLQQVVQRGLVALEEAQFRTAHQEELDALLRA
jgi:hypothetical protein